MKNIDGSPYKVWYDSKTVLKATHSFARSLEKHLNQDSKVSLPNGTRTVLLERIDERGDGGEYNLSIVVKFERDSEGKIGHRTCQFEPNGLIRCIQHDAVVVAEKVELNATNVETVNEANNTTNKILKEEELSFAELDTSAPSK